MTFDDGPTAGVTERLIAALRDAGARATFDVVGSTAANYPDRPGRAGTPAWSGVRFDHYAAFGRDAEAGVVAQPALARALAAAGCELANHSYRHVQFAPERFVYGRRACLPDADAVRADLLRLDDLLRDVCGGAPPAFARPPHYVDGPAYDVFAALGYQYLAASFDGGGWRPSCGDERRDVAAMVTPLELALKADPDALDGRIVFQKDGCNMSLRTPIVEALPLQLAVLARHGYRVVTAAELWAEGPFADVRGQDWPEARTLAGRGLAVAYRDNALRPDQPLTRGELALWLDGLQAVPGGTSAAAPRDVPAAHPYAAAIARVAATGQLRCDAARHFRPGEPVTADEWAAAGLPVPVASPVPRGEALRWLAAL